MNNLKSLLIALFFLSMAGVSAQNYDSVSGATQKADGKYMNLEQFKKALDIKQSLIFATVNKDGTPNAAAYGSFKNIEGNIFAVNSMADSKTTKVNVVRAGQAILILTLDGKTKDGFDGTKVVLKHIDDKDKIKALRAKMEKSSEKTTFFAVDKFLLYH